MASAQEAEEFIQSLNGNGADQRHHVERSVKRLLFEILWFTSNKSFHRAKAADEPPFILFKIYPDKIVINCNHDNFTKADLQAICQQGSGETMKGANFKSIVAATEKVHIQSGNFSFEFRNSIFNIHSDVMRPVWVTPTETIPDNLTRVTLYLTDQGSKEEIQKLRGFAASQFERLEGESILFLDDLISMRVEYFHDLGKMYRSKDFRKHQVDINRVSVKLTTVDEGLEKKYDQLYHVTEQAAADDSMRVKLAFPLWDNLKVGGDNYGCGLFNFVQLEESPLRFHIHADFDIDCQHAPTAASTRTLAIKDLVASAFFQAVLQLCEHPTLRYHWPSFLMSGLEDSDAFLSSLEADTRNWISHNPVLISRNNKHWRHISHLTILGADAQDAAGNPLLDDPIVDPFVSTIYPPEAIRNLESYGLASLGSDQLLKLLELRSDVTCSEKHRVHPTNWSFPDRTSWNQPFARLVSKNLLDKNQLERILCTSLAHKRNEELAYYVRSSILKRLSSSNDISLSDMKRYLVYLYLTHQSSLSFEGAYPYQSVKVMTLDMQLVRPRDTIVYIPNMDHPYGPEGILGADFSGSLNFLHRDILNEEPKAPRIFHPSWKGWLCDCLGVRQRLSLLQLKVLAKPHLGRGASDIVQEDVLSEELRFVVEKRPGQLLGLIQYLWAFDGPQLMKSLPLVEEIRGLPVQVLCPEDDTMELKHTWVPLNVLREKVCHYMENPDQFPFLDLGSETSMDMTIHTKWNFLVKDLEVHSQDDMDFLLEILNCIKWSSDALSSWQTKRVFELYTAINTRLQLAIEDEKQIALDFFEGFSGVLYIDEAGPIWTGLSSCRWKAPANLITICSLETFLKSKHVEQQQMNSLSELFSAEMGVKDVSVKDLVEELLVLRNEGCEDVARVTEIYKYLDESFSASEEIRTAFEECAVILIEKDGHSTWLTAPLCYWSEADTTPLNSSLRGCYPDLESFFVQKLSIKVSAYDKLLDLSTDTEDHSMIQGLLLSLMDETDGSLNHFPLEPLRKAKIFVVTSPWDSDQSSIPKLCSVDADFAIGDRPQLQVLLESSIKMLAYDLTAVRRLQPLFRWFSMEDRYLSRCVEEKFQDVSPLPIARWKLGEKAYQIARVGATFHIYGSSDDSLSLYKQLVELEIVEVDWISTSLEAFQDGQTIKSRMTHQPAAWVSESHSGLTIYVRRNTRGPEWNPASALPKTLQQWLMKSTCQSSGINGLEVLEVLSSIFTVSGSDLDKILWEQGIVKVPFENIELSLKKAMIKVRLPEVDERKPCA